MIDYELELFDRINAIKDTISKYGEENFCLSFSGGKDSTILHYLLDIALPNNKIPRVFINTGIEYIYIFQFVQELAKDDDRFVIIKPTKSVKQICEQYGYPFKSKEHSTKLDLFQKGSRSKSVLNYMNDRESKHFGCPKELLLQFSEDYKFKVSAKCCHYLKKEPFKRYQRESGRTIFMTGMRKEEGGQRTHLTCIITDKNGNIKKFHPLVKVDEDWENEFIKRNNVKLCKLYYPPYNFKRTGCRFCPYALELENQLEVAYRLLPNEAKAGELIWKPVFDEYRRLGYRLHKTMQIKLDLETEDK